VSVTRLNHFQAAPGQGPALGVFLAALTPAVLGPGCQSAQVMVKDGQPERLVVLEIWDSVEAHQAAAKAIPPELLAQVMPLLAERPNGDYYRSLT
jgi:quinol monooxygenase YgiN